MADKGRFLPLETHWLLMKQGQNHQGQEVKKGKADQGKVSQTVKGKEEKELREEKEKLQQPF